MRFMLTKGCIDTKYNKKFGINTKAVIDTIFHGLVPCIVIAINGPAYGQIIGRDEITVKVTKDHLAYKKGEVLKCAACDVIPRTMLRKGTYRMYCIPFYTYEG